MIRERIHTQFRSKSGEISTKGGYVLYETAVPLRQADHGERPPAACASPPDGAEEGSTARALLSHCTLRSNILFLSHSLVALYSTTPPLRVVSALRRILRRTDRSVFSDTRSPDQHQCPEPNKKEPESLYSLSDSRASLPR
ncbi:hypothetical protein TYRP_001189 [Tyrophagus putrescentiae]|nr:hypothetical protein TYRP_001189 [Tyrophagus putrescentiae]